MKTESANFQVIGVKKICNDVNYLCRDKRGYFISTDPFAFKHYVSEEYVAAHRDEYQ